MTTLLSRGTPPGPAGPSAAPVPARRHRRGPAPLLVAGAVAAGLVALTPLVYLAVRALEPGLAVFAEIVARPRTGELLVRSVSLAGAVTGACLVLGTVGAWLVVRTDLPGRRTWAVLLVLPLAVPSYVAGFTWISKWPDLAGFPGAFLVLYHGHDTTVLLDVDGVAVRCRTAEPVVPEVGERVDVRVAGAARFFPG